MTDTLKPTLPFRDMSGAMVNFSPQKIMLYVPVVETDPLSLTALFSDENPELSAKGIQHIINSYDAQIAMLEEKIEEMKKSKARYQMELL